LVLFGDVQTRRLFGRVFQKEAARVDIAALYLLDEPFRDLSNGIDRRGARAVSVLLGAFPIIGRADSCHINDYGQLLGECRRRLSEEPGA
jgi:hypothetical protein